MTMQTFYQELQVDCRKNGVTLTPFDLQANAFLRCKLEEAVSGKKRRNYSDMRCSHLKIFSIES
jgi:hypothetical protein